jgi:uncharacterized protein (DUF1501 family)
LNIVIPYGEDAYHRARPNLRLAPPNVSIRNAGSRVADLDGFFGLHPALAPLLPIYKEGSLAFVHAVGSGDQTRSHFEAMTAMERGLARPGSGLSSGWLGRHLSSHPASASSPLRAVAFSSGVPDSLRGTTDAVALPSLTDFRLNAPPGAEDDRGWHATLADLYGHGADDVTLAGRDTLFTLDALRKMDPANYEPARGAVYPDNALGSGLKQTACLIKGRIGLEVACLDHGGWDTHVAQGATEGWQPLLLGDLGRSLAAFARDLGGEMRRVTVLVMTEFGRRVQENSGLGTDHGRGSVMFLVGGGVRGGKVYGNWPGLEPGQLEPPGDLRVTTDYRDVLAELLTYRLGNRQLGDVFPGYAPRTVSAIC